MTRSALLVGVMALAALGCDRAAAGERAPRPDEEVGGSAPSEEREAGRAGRVRAPTPWRADRSWSAEERTSGAERRRGTTVRGLFARAGLSFPPRRLLLRAFKIEDQLEVWAADGQNGPLTLVAIYGVCASSGRIGPKRREGDRQVPEGFYRLSFFHDRSKFHLAMRVSYPNAADRVHADPTEPGGDIMIHGGCRSVGCLAMSDERIEELWVMARATPSDVEVHVLPTRKMDELLTDRPGEPHRAFWANLREGFDRFEKTRQLPVVTMDDGRYRFADPK